MEVLNKMKLKCCKCKDITDWRDIKKWNEKDNFYCPDCVEISEPHKLTEIELKTIYDSPLKYK